MPTITGTLSDIGLAPLTGLNPELRFTPSSPAVNREGRVFASKPVEVTPNSSGAFSVDLASTVDLVPRGTHWRVQVLHRSPSADASGFTVSDFLPLKLFVTGDTTIGDAIGEFTPNDFVYVGEDAPNSAKSAFMFQFHPVTGDLYERQA